MRTTIELSEKQIGELKKLAAQRRMKGFSDLVKEAVDLYLESGAFRKGKVIAALKVMGTFHGKSGQEFEEKVHAAREVWR
jgi:hypothetical protein